MTSVEVLAPGERRVAVPHHVGRGEYTFKRHAVAVDRAVSYMRSNASEPLTLGDVSGVAHCSPWHFDRTFTAITGLSPMRYLSVLRIELAKLSVLNSDRRIIDIAYDVGYNSLGSFGKRFTELVGLSPRELRKAADCFDPDRWRALLEHSYDRRQSAPMSDGLAIAGEVSCDVPGLSAGWALVAAMPSSHPTAKPVACSISRLPGHFVLKPVPPGRYSILAVGYPGGAGLTQMLMQEGVLRGRVGAVRVGPNPTLGSIKLVLRPAQLSDVPIVPPYPILLERAVAARAHA